MQTKSVNSLTSMRFLAAYMVVGSHFFSFPAPFDFLNEFFRRGHLGVEFFFILSGFVLGMRYHEEIVQGKLQRLKFFLYRMARIAPAYYLSLFMATFLLYRGIRNSDFLSDTGNLILFTLSNLTFTQSFIPVNLMLENWNLPSWSLSVEFIFYAAFPFLSVPLLQTKRTKEWLAGLFLLTIIIFSVVSSLPEFINFMGHETRVTWVNNPLLRLPQFLMGTLLAKVYLHSVPSRKIHVAYYAGLMGTILLFTLPIPHQFIDMGSPLPILVFGILIFSGAVIDNGTGIWSNKTLIYLGEASYSLYIFQVPLKTIFQQIYSKLFQLGVTEGFLYCLYISICLIVSSCLLYSFYELPMNKYLRKRING